MELEKLKKIIGSVMNVDAEKITEETTFVDDLGADSLDIFQMLLLLEEEYDIEFDNGKIEEIQCVKDAVKVLKEAIS